MREKITSIPLFYFFFVFSFLFLLCVPVNGYGHGGTVSSPNHIFSWASLNEYFLHIPFLKRFSKRSRMTVEIISRSIPSKVWDRAGIQLMTPGSAVRHASVAGHFPDCATRHSLSYFEMQCLCFTYLDMFLEGSKKGWQLFFLYIYQLFEL